ncbi:hypothetical protein DFH06DRAFT_1143718 [Mycena polygramma]|nr:hypothetical protein DFH06DRAFT_1143718 [Mycena polygramma]
MPLERFTIIYSNLERNTESQGLLAYALRLQPLLKSSIFGETPFDPGAPSCPSLRRRSGSSQPPKGYTGHGTFESHERTPQKPEPRWDFMLRLFTSFTGTRKMPTGAVVQISCALLIEKRAAYQYQYGLLYDGGREFRMEAVLHGPIAQLKYRVVREQRRSENGSGGNSDLTSRPAEDGLGSTFSGEHRRLNVAVDLAVIFGHSAYQGLPAVCGRPPGGPATKQHPNRRDNLRSAVIFCEDRCQYLETLETN